MSSRWSRKPKVNEEVQHYLEFITADTSSDNLKSSSSAAFIPSSINYSSNQSHLSDYAVVEPAAINKADADDGNGGEDNVSDMNDSSTEYLYSTSEYESGDTDLHSDHSGEDVIKSNDIEERLEPDISSEELHRELRYWAVSCNITHIALSRLLLILRKHLKSLPKDARTFLYKSCISCMW